jgi:site-specific recombinase XerD
MSRPEEATKGEERRSVPIQDEDTQEFVEAWFSIHSELDISRTTAYRYVKKTGEEAGLDKEVTPMDLRRYAAER